MKKITFGILVFAAGLLISSSVFAQIKNAIKINPASLGILTGNIAYERALNEKLSIQPSFFYSGFNVSGVKYTGLGGNLDLRIHTGSKGELEGFYIEPFVRFMNFSLSEEFTEGTAKAQSTIIGGGLAIGYQWIIGDHFCIDWFLGPQYLSASTKSKETVSNYSTPEFKINGVAVRFGLGIGYAF